MTQVPLRLFSYVAKAEQAFRDFHRDNPSVYRELVRLAREAKARGRNRIGIRMLWERMRWHFAVEIHHPEGEPRLNDHHTSFYARLIQQQEPDLRGLFETRGRR